MTHLPGSKPARLPCRINSEDERAGLSYRHHCRVRDHGPEERLGSVAILAVRGRDEDGHSPTFRDQKPASRIRPEHIIDLARIVRFEVGGLQPPGSGDPSRAMIHSLTSVASFVAIIVTHSVALARPPPSRLGRGSRLAPWTVASGLSCSRPSGEAISGNDNCSGLAGISRSKAINGECRVN